MDLKILYIAEVYLNGHKTSICAFFFGPESKIRLTSKNSFSVVPVIPKVGVTGGAGCVLVAAYRILVCILLVAVPGELGAAHPPVSLLSDITHSGACSSWAPG